MRQKQNFFFLVLCLVLSNQVFSQKIGAISPYDKTDKIEKKVSNSEELEGEYSATLFERRTDAEMNKWRSNRFGQFFHFGLYSILGSEYKGEWYYAGEWIKSFAQIPDEEYNKLLDEFNPTKFDADKWAEMDVEMGVKYMIITTKHHDGFCLWNSKFTEFCVKNTPYKKDLVGPLVKAFNKRGIDIVLYYSIIDWNHKDYRSSINSEDDKKAMERYVDYVINQLKELLTNYPEASAFWFDGQWEDAYVKNPQWGWRIEQAIRKIRPNMVINNRLRSDIYGNGDRDKAGKHYCDYDSSYERTFPSDSVVYRPSLDWEACATIAENGWGYSKRTQDNLKDAKAIVRSLVLCASNGGNYVLNFGPKPDGTFVDYELKLAKEIGQWMKINGKAIYNTSSIDLRKPNWGYLTRNNEKMYAILFEKPEVGFIHLPLQYDEVKDFTVLGNKNTSIITQKCKDGTVALDVSKLEKTSIANVIEFTYKK